MQTATSVKSSGIPKSTKRTVHAKRRIMNGGFFIFAHLKPDYDDK